MTALLERLKLPRPDWLDLWNGICSADVLMQALRQNSFLTRNRTDIDEKSASCLTFPSPHCSRVVYIPGHLDLLKPYLEIMRLMEVTLVRNMSHHGCMTGRWECNNSLLILPSYHLPILNVSGRNWSVFPDFLLWNGKCKSSLTFRSHGIWRIVNYKVKFNYSL